MKISHAAGHARVTPGKQDPEGMKEWSYTDKIVRLVMDKLNDYEDVEQKRIDYPTGHVDIPLAQRARLVNDWGADVHIDYHLNAYGSGSWSSASGIETYVYKTKPNEAVELAKKVQDNLVSSLGFANRGVKVADFHMLRETKMTAVLIEFAFMTNRDEAYKMRTANYQERAAQAVVNALVQQYNLKKKKQKEVEPVRRVDKVSKWAEKDWKEATEKGFFDGTRPGDLLTREEAAIVVNRIIRYVKEGD